MSTSLILGVVGGIVGGVVGGVAGAQGGFVIGSTVGSAIDASNQRITNYGPRLGELKVQASQYGGAIARLYGTTRIAGNVIFSTDIKEAQNRTSRRQGKGGPKVTTIEYVYTVDMAVGLCEGEITGVRRIWANGKVIYDASETATAETIVASAQVAKGITVYTGTETQLPDPTIEAFWGVGNTPAYRGLAYIVFDELLLTQEFGYRIPQLEFEVVKAGEINPVVVIGEAVTSPLGALNNRVTAAHVPTTGEDTIFFTEDGYQIDGYLVPSKIVNVWSVGLGGGSLIRRITKPEFHFSYVGQSGYSDEPGIFFRKIYAETTSDPGVNVFMDPLGNTREFVLAEFKSGYSTSTATSTWCKRGDRLLICGDSSLSVAYPVPGGNWGHAVTLCDFGTGQRLATAYLSVGAGNSIGRVLLTDSYAWVLWQDSVSNAQHIEVLSSEDLSAVGSFDLPSKYDNSNNLGFGTGDTDNLLLWANQEEASIDYSEVISIDSSGAITVLLSEESPAFERPLDSMANSIWLNGGTVFARGGEVTGSDITMYGYVAAFASLAAVGVPLSEILSAECALCGVDPADLDVTDCTENVMGYAIGRVATARANTEPLLTAYRRDAIESEWKLKFPKRGSAPVLTIPYEDLGAEEADVSQAEPLATTRAQELDLPRTVLVSYINADQDYQGGTEPSRRLITRAQKELAVDVAVVMGPDQAAQVADAIMYDTWTARTARSLSVLRKYSKLESGDVFNVIDRTGNTLRLRSVETEYAGPVIKINTVEDDPTVNTQTSTGAVPGRPQSVIPLAPGTVAEFLDIPILQDADDDPGIYAALRPVRATGWSGAELLRESDGGDLSRVGVVRNSATVGTADTVLGGWSGGNVFDEANTLTVTLFSGELDSVTRADLVDGTANALLVGSEIVQFANCSLVSGSTYELSGFLRGRRGTESFQGSHQVGERVVLLSIAGMLRASMGVAELNAPQLFDTRSLGRGNLSQYAVTNTGVGLKPFAVADLRRSGDAFVWNRRTRLRHRFLAAGIDPPLGEQIEAYDAVLADSGGAILESASVSVPGWAPSTALTAGQVVTVYQRSAAVGRGYPSSLTI